MSISRPFALRVLAAAALLTAGLASTAQAAKNLEWKFKEGEKLNYALRQSVGMLADFNGIELDIKIKWTMDTAWTVKSISSDGNAQLSLKVERLQLMLNTPFTGEFKYDSADKESKPEGEVWERLGKPAEAMLEGEFALTVSKKGKVSDVKLPEDLVKALSEGGGGGGQAMMMGGGMFTESSIKQLFEQAVLPLPEESVADGVTWNKKLENKMGPLGTQKIDVVFSYAGTEEQDGKVLEKIGAKTEVAFEAAEEGDLEIEMELTEQEGTGEILFDAEAGKTVKSSITQKLTMSGDFMGNEFEQETTLNLLLQAGSSDGLPSDEEESAEESADSDSDSDADKKPEDEKKEDEKKDE